MFNVLTIAGSDPSGGAGIQADLRVINALGGYGMGVVTAITAQSTQGVSRVWPLSCEQVAVQAATLLDDVVPDAVKVGMLGSADAAKGVLETLQRYELPNVVVDTILLSSSGVALFDVDHKDILLKIMRCATIVTPNIPEAEALLGVSGHEAADMARRLSDLCDGVSVMITGGHGDGNTLTDTVYDASEDHLINITHTRVDTPNTHGTGCALSSSLACYLAQGFTLSDAARKASSFVHHALTGGQSLTFGHGHGPAFFG
ncbi:MAG: bifunctional hydroxymethylpyrimidine kinase/phosphomethylpyrimidine kinase [Bacteroidaceae bacterium]|nr:bifunctional hydroxymethylpyrimidine kinase/phosphomethylpyrimidine kinase [Bacteroidaceae bacterium]